MAKAYWISCYRKIKNADKLAAYAKIAGPAVLAGGGRFVVRGVASQVFEDGVKERTVVVEFDSLAAAVAARESPAYQEALRALGDGVERDFRIAEGAG